MVAVVGEKNRVVRTHGGAMRPLENAVAPGAKKVAVAVEDDHRMLAARKTINLILAIDSDRRHFMKSPIAGQFSPSFDHFITELAAS